MEYKKYEYPSFNIYTVKTNRFKTCHMEIIFRDEVKKEEILAKAMLADIMTDCSSIYPNRREMAKRLEELYDANFYGVTNKIGNTFLTSFVLSFLNPRYVNDKTYLMEVLKLPIEAIMKPFIMADEFDIKNFNIVKNRFHDEILAINEDIGRVATKNALSNLEGDTPTKLNVLGTIEELEEITPKRLSEVYNSLINTNNCDIFIIGDLDMDKIANIIFKYFKNPVIKTKEPSIYVENKGGKLKKVIGTSKFLETSLVNIYSMSNLTKKEKTITVYFYNYLLGGGGLNSKLYQLLREKNGLCYGIKSMYLKYDNLLMIETSLSKNNVKKGNRLIAVALKEMAEGKFTDKDLDNARENFIFSLSLALDSPQGIINNYVFHVLDDLPLISERIKLVKDITKEEIVKVANKIKPNILYVLEGEENGSN